MDTVTIALAKGRLGEKTMDILERCGVDCSQVRDAGRKLVFDNQEGYKFLLVKPRRAHLRSSRRSRYRSSWKRYSVRGEQTFI